MSAALIGLLHWSASRTPEGQREYKVKFRVKTDSPEDGPHTVRLAVGLPIDGTTWSLGNDFDPWAFCLPTDDISPDPNHNEDDLFRYWIIEKTFATPGHPSNGPSILQRCNDTQIENPLLEPPRISFPSSRFTEEATRDRFGIPIMSSSGEMLRGQQNEWDDNRDSIRIEQNVATFAEVAFAKAMSNFVNLLPIWGYPARCVKLSTVTAERKYYGQCFVYYTLVMEFETNLRTFDRDLLDEGTKVLNGHWDVDDGAWVIDRIGTGADERLPNRWNPGDFITFPDLQGNPIRGILNGFGLPAGVLVRVSDTLTATEIAQIGGEHATQDARWVSIRSGGHTGRPLTDQETWLEISNYDQWVLQGVVYVPPNFVLELFYDPGAVVFDPTTQLWYVATTGNTYDPPPSASWVAVPAVTDQGSYSQVTAYTLGDYVSQVPGGGLTQFYTTVGYRHVEKYPAANFVVLGVPLTF